MEAQKVSTILKWNAIALEANKVDFSGPKPTQGGPTLSSRALALVHIAMYDAHFGATGFVGGNNPFLTGLAPAPVGTSTSDAAASAAHATLSHLYPDQAAFFDSLHCEPANAFGESVAKAALASGFGEFSPTAGIPNPVPYPRRGDRYKHQVDPFNPMQALHGALYGRSKRFAVVKPILLSAPSLPGTKAYDDDAKEVLEKGAHAGYRELKRTPDETMIGQFWAYDGVPLIGTPPRLYNQIVRRIMQLRGTILPNDQIRLLTLVNVAMGDSGILAWHEKFTHDFWRPVVGIRQHDPSTGPAPAPGTISDAIADPFWQPLGAPFTNGTQMRFTPPFPAYPSGHATFGAAALQMVRRFYGHSGNGDDQIDFDLVSDEQNGSSQSEGNLRTRHSRKFSSCLQAIYENSVSRVFLGVHWRFDGLEGDSFAKFKTLLPKSRVGGVPLGISIANDIFDGKMKKP